MYIFKNTCVGRLNATSGTGVHLLRIIVSLAMMVVLFGTWGCSGGPEGPPTLASQEFLRFTADGTQVTVGAITADGTVVDEVPELMVSNMGEAGTNYSTYGFGIQEKAYVIGLSFLQQNSAVPVTHEISFLIGSDQDFQNSIETLAFVTWLKSDETTGFVPDKITGSLTVTGMADSHIRGTFRLTEIGHIEDGNGDTVGSNVTMEITNGEFNLKLTIGN